MEISVYVAYGAAVIGFIVQQSGESPITMTPKWSQCFVLLHESFVKLQGVETEHEVYTTSHELLWSL